ncbi:hypothetical protein ACI77O_12845 [Pseudomonas tritici]|uniref:COG3904 family protein n=1 Tax=Pseudomonas tritici TaxID=2745518 RepID=UPI00387B0E21
MAAPRILIFNTLALFACAVGLLAPPSGVASSLFVEPNDPRLTPAKLTTFDTQRFTQVVIDGYIHQPTVNAFRRKIEDGNSQFGIVYFNSAGGDLTAAEELGRLIRAKGFATQIGKMSADSKRIEKGVCESACPIAFVGGKFRLLDTDTGHLGVHRFYLAKQGRWASDSKLLFSAERDLKAYLDEMGIDPEFFEVMMKTPIERIQPIKQRSAYYWKLGTGSDFSSWAASATGGLVGLGETSTGGMSMTFECDGTSMHTQVKFKPWFPPTALLNYETHSITVNGHRFPVDQVKAGLDKPSGFLTFDTTVSPSVIAKLAGADSVGYSLSFDHAPGEYTRSLRLADSGKALLALSVKCKAESAVDKKVESTQVKPAREPVADKGYLNKAPSR